MRVKFGECIYLCRKIEYTAGHGLLFITTIYNHVYTVDCFKDYVAATLYNKALVNGYIDVSIFAYSH